MDKSYILIIKGFIIGLGKIIPGVSGSLLAISMGIYDKALDVIGNFFRDIKNNIKFLMPIGIGLLLAIIFFGNIISFLLTKHYFITMMLFLGLIVGGVPSLFKTFYKTKIKTKDYYFLLIVSIICIVFNLFFLNYGIFIRNLLTNSIIYWIVIGFIDALTMIIPGISGTAIFMTLGCYEEIINMYANPLGNINCIIPFIIGVISTILLLTKIISWLFKNSKKSMYLIIIILLIMSLVSLISNVLISTITILQLCLGIFLFFIGFLVSYVMEN